MQGHAEGDEFTSESLFFKLQQKLQHKHVRPRNVPLIWPLFGDG